MRKVVESVLIFSLLLSPSFVGAFFDQQNNQSITQEK